MSIAVAIVDDSPEIRRNLRRFIGEAPGFRCTCACASGEEALQQLPQNPPDVVLMDIQMPGLSGIEWYCRLQAPPAVGSRYDAHGV